MTVPWNNEGRMDFRKVGVWTITIFIGAVFLMSGALKFSQAAMWQERFATQWGLPGWLVSVTGLLEMAGAVLIFMPRRAVYGGSIIAAVMIGALGTHAMAGELRNVGVTAVLGSLAAFVAWYRCPWCKTESASDDA